MAVQRPNGLKRCSGYGPAGILPHYADPKEFSKCTQSSDGLQSMCKEHNKVVNTRRNGRTNADPKYDPARARARERRAERKEKAWIEPGWNKAKSLAFWGRHCHICWEYIEGPIEYDHIIPVSRGGEYSVANVHPAHPACNQWKRDKLMEELDLTKVPKCGIIEV